MPRLLSRRLTTTHAPLGIAAVFLHQLYYNDPKPKYHKNVERGLTNFLQNCVSKGPSEVTQLQKELQNIKLPTIHIYLPVAFSDVPTHYITLDRDPSTNRWKLMHSKIRAISTVQAYGLLVSWMSFTPTPSIALDVQPTLKPISRGKGAFELLIDTLINSTDAKLIEEAKQCTQLAQMFGQARNGRIAFFYVGNKPQVSGARISFAFDDNYNFSEPRVRKAVDYPERFHIRVIDTNVSELTIIPYTQEYIPDDFEDVPPPIDMMLTARLFSHIGFKNPKDKVDVYCLNYYQEEIVPVKIMENRSLTVCRSAMPLIEPNKKGYWPNEIMALEIKRMLLNHDQPYFFSEMLRLISFFVGAPRTENFNRRLFDYYSPLSDIEMQRIDDYAEKLVEVPVDSEE